MAAFALNTSAMAKEESKQSEAGNWSGFSFFVGIGTGSVDHNIDEDHTNHGYERGFDYDIFNNFDEITDGIFGTFGIGYDRQVSERFVLGLFTDFDISSSGSTNSFTTDWIDERDQFISDGFFTTNESTSLEHKYSWNVGGRFGYLVRPNTMIYGLVGYTRGKFHQNFGFNGTVGASALTSSTNSSRDLTFHGITLGAGLERRLANNLFIRGEYRYTDFRKKSTSDRSDIVLNGPNGYSVTSDGETFDPSNHTGRISLVVKFN
ncbi:MAG: porin family protein [bacterium]|nr:porin family protein [bacterium]